MSDDGFFGFKCSHCQADIEVTPDIVGEAVECPACGQRIVVPEIPAGETVRPTDDEKSAAMLSAEKSRTIRIELGEL